MAEREECNILLTAYSGIYGFLTSLESLDHNLEDLRHPMYEDDIECSFMDKALVTSESALKYLVLPKKEGKGERPIEIDKVFAFTTDDTKKGKINPEDLEDNTKEVIELPKTYFLSKDKPAYLYKNNIKTYEFTNDKEFIDTRLKEIYKYAWMGKCENIDLQIEEIPIKDETRGIETNVENIFEMIGKVIDYIEMKKKHYDVHVYVDITGGFRTIPVYLLFVLNVLEKRGIEVYKTLYAQMARDLKGTPKTIEIDDLTPILKTQNFINGIHEFIEFGSAQALIDYFKEALKLSSENTYEPRYNAIIEGVVDSVEAFAEAITISNRKEFEKAVQKIKDAWGILDDLVIESIDDSDAKSEVPIERYIENRNLRLLKVFAPKIKEEYKNIWPLETGQSRNGLDYIQWCLDHNFIQQALTMYIEIVPEILFDHNDTNGILNFVRTNKRKIIGGIDKKVKRNHKTIVETSKVPDRLYESTKDALIKQHKAGKSEYKFLYWLLNQYTTNIESSRKSEIVEKIKRDKAMCIEALKRYCTRTGKKWEQNKDIHIDKENVDVFFENIKIAYKKELKGQPVNLGFDCRNTSWELCTLDIDQFSKNWQWIINLFSNQFKVRDFCMNTIEILLQIIKANRNKLGGNKDEGIVDALKKIINEQKEYKISGIVMSRIEVFFGYLYLKEKLKDIIKSKIVDAFNAELDKDEKVNDNDVYTYRNSINDIYNRINFVELLKKSIEDIKRDIENLPKNKIYTIRTEYLNDSNFGGDDIIDIILPYTINGIGIPEYPKLVKAITSLDKYSKVDDIESLIAKNLLVINEGIFEEFKQNKDEYRVNAKDILERIQSITGNDLEKAGEIADKYLRIIPESVGGMAADVDIWNRDGLTLLILRTLLYPYNTLKLIRNDSVHAREKRNIKATRENVELLIKDSIQAIKKYLNAVK